MNTRHRHAEINSPHTYISFWAPTYHQRHSLNGSWGKWNSLLYSKDTLSNKWPCQESDAMVLINLALKFHFKKKVKKQTGNDKYKRNPSHKICLEASIWTGRGQQHQSQEPPPPSLLPSSHICELTSAFSKKDETYPQPAAHWGEIYLIFLLTFWFISIIFY